MKKFKFKLDIVLKERKKTEDLKLREWTISKKILQRMYDELASYENAIKRTVLDADQLLVGVTEGQEHSVGFLSSIDQFIKCTKIKITWKKQDIARGEKLTERKRQEYVFATQKREALEKLKEKQIESFKEELNAKELKDLEDLYIMRARGSFNKNEDEEDSIL